MTGNARKNLLLIGPFPPPYHGVSIYSQKLFRMLRQDPELDVKIIDTSDHRADLNNLGRFDFLNIYSALKSIFKLIVILLIKRVDIVYIPISQNTLAYIRDGIFIILSKLFRCKVIIHLHGSYFLDFYNKSLPLYKKFIDISIKKVDGAIVLGEKLKYIFEKWLPYNRIFVLPNFVEEPNLNTETENKSQVVFTNSSNQIVKITYLGNIVESKGIFDLIKAVELLLSKGLKVVLQIAGKIGKDPLTGKTKNETEILLRSKIKDFPLNIKFMGQITDDIGKYTLLKNSDIFAYPSYYAYEGQPLVIIEAMSCGLPIVSTKDCGIIDETVIDGYNGILIEKRNIEQLAGALEKLIVNPDLRRAMGLNSYKRYLENYTPLKHLEIFKSILFKI